ncbi:hypothetical protein NP493_99g05073 [Ridgeia piscesae]|uniref:Ubiquitin-like protein ATG12 n=1 Tax=Ridgeia piscesae TaxID=27915 RepID=A0AAD9P7S6_RIDPI|nr:hypothetical protein NP493_99g05073 [Ridgeia piscesae]
MDEVKSEDDTVDKATIGDEDRNTEAVKTGEDKNNATLKTGEDKTSEVVKINKEENSDAVKMDGDKNSDAVKVDGDQTGGNADGVDASAPEAVSATEPVGSPAVQSDSPAARSDSPAARKKKAGKVDILFKATGNAPIMKKSKWSVEETKPVAAMVDFIRRYLKTDTQQSIFIYVNQSFAPSPDVALGVLFECFGSDGKLVLHYCMTQAWG